MMLPSGNDAAFALAEYFGQVLKDKKYTGNQDNTMFSNFQSSPFALHPTVKYFLKEMNNNAAKLKMNDTHYDSPHGLKNTRNFATAYDICLLVTECMKIPTFWEVVSTPFFETKSLGNEISSRNGHLGKKMTMYQWETTNKLLGLLDGLYGCKTGITTAAGPCFAGYYEKDGMKLALILCHSKSSDIRW
jgi:D-alanyl-D-alanine carboxypeptidase